MSTGHDHTSKGPSKRQLRVGELLRRALSDVIMRGGLHDPELAHAVITVAEVRVSPDLGVATAYVLPLGGQNTKEVIAALSRNQGEIRHQLTRLVDMKFIPTFRFLPDETFDQMDKTRRLLNDERVRRDVEAPDAPTEHSEDE